MKKKAKAVFFAITCMHRKALRQILNNIAPWEHVTYGGYITRLIATHMTVEHVVNE